CPRTKRPKVGGVPFGNHFDRSNWSALPAAVTTRVRHGDLGIAGAQSARLRASSGCLGAKKAAPRSYEGWLKSEVRWDEERVDQRPLGSRVPATEQEARRRRTGGRVVSKEKPRTS